MENLERFCGDRESVAMADINSACGELVHGGQFIKHNICGHIFEVTAEYRPPIMPFGCGSAYGIVCMKLDVEFREERDDCNNKIADDFDNYTDAKRTLREIKLL